MDLTTGSLDISAIEDTEVNVIDRHVCDICNYSTNRKSNLVRHAKVHRVSVECPPNSTPNSKEPISKKTKPVNEKICDHCGKSFKSRYGLSLHILRHENKFKHTCSVCQKGYNQTVQFRFHCMSHQKLAVTKCTFCKKTFQGHSSLQRHTKICTLNPESKSEDLQNKFSCEECALVFATKDRLTCHKKGKHGAPRYICDTCGRPYKWRSSLLYHKKLCKNM